MTKLSSTLPGGDNNGLGSLARALTTDPHKTALIVAVVDCKSITIDTDTGDKVATVRIRRVEPIDPEDTESAQRLLARGLERRTGAVMLPMDLEDELSKLFENLVESVDLETGEITIHTDDPDTTAVVSDVPNIEAEADDELAKMFDEPPPLRLVEPDDEQTAFKPNPPKAKRRRKPKDEPEPAPVQEDETPPWNE